MRYKDQIKIGFYILLINVLLILFLITSKDIKDNSLIIASLSSMAAIILNHACLKKYRNYYNLITLIINIIITNVLVLFMLEYL